MYCKSEVLRYLWKYYLPYIQKNKKQCTNLSSQYFPCFHFSARMPSRETTALVFGLTRTAVGVIIIYCKYSCQSRLYACWLVCQWCNIAPHTTQQLFHKNENQFSHSLSCQAWNMFNIPYCRQCQVSLFITFLKCQLWFLEPVKKSVHFLLERQVMEWQT